MGLDVSHNAFRASYSAFNRLRQVVCKAVGGSYPPHEDPNLDPDSWYWEGDDYSQETHPGLHEFLSHSDCGGEITPENCIVVASELAALLPAVDSEGLGGGHIRRDGGYGQVLRRFIAGCWAAAAANEPLTFD